MRKILLLIGLFALGLNLTSLVAEEGPPEDAKFTPSEEQQYYYKLKDEIEKTGKGVVELQKKVTVEMKDFEGDLKDEFTEKVNTLEAKQVLYKNFEHTPSIKDPEIREELMEVFEKPVIKQKDLQDLKESVDSEKAKWPAERQAQMQTQ